MKSKLATFVLLLNVLSIHSYSAEAVKKIESKNQSNQVSIDVAVTDKGFEPSTIKTAHGKSVILNVTRKTDETCAVAIQVPSKKIKKDLPLNQTVSIDLGILEKGEISFGCGMNMMEGGRIITK